MPSISILNFQDGVRHRDGENVMRMRRRSSERLNARHAHAHKHMAWALCRVLVLETGESLGSLEDLCISLMVKKSALASE